MGETTPFLTMPNFEVPAEIRYGAGVMLRLCELE